MNNDFSKDEVLILRNMNAIADNFPWEGRKAIAMAAEYFSVEGIDADIMRMKECEEIIRNNTRFLSPFRGHLKMVLICQMYDKENPEEFFFSIQEEGAEHYLEKLLEEDDIFAEFLRGAMHADIFA
ncbi:MAG: DUF4003 family protein [Clostridiales bacterium]|nr:DUF4003 family protein [Candidatus Crickella caballi]